MLGLSKVEDEGKEKKWTIMSCVASGLCPLGVVQNSNNNV